jgi:hypothetical protein
MMLSVELKAVLGVWRAGRFRLDSEKARSQWRDGANRMKNPLTDDMMYYYILIQMIIFDGF